MELLKEITALMEQELLHTVEYTKDGISIKVTKAGWKTDHEASDISEAKGKEVVDDEVLFWSAGGSAEPVL